MENSDVDSLKKNNLAYVSGRGIGMKIFAHVPL